MPHRYAYPVDLEPDEDGAVFVSFPDLPEALTGGGDAAEAMALAVDCLETAIAWRINRRQDIPPPSPARGRPTVAPSALIAAKAALYAAMREAGMTKVALAEHLGCQETEVRRMLDPRHATKIGRLEDALGSLGKGLVVEARDVA